jgi:hypothetical protein
MIPMTLTLLCDALWRCSGTSGLYSTEEVNLRSDDTSQKHACSLRRPKDDLSLTTTGGSEIHRAGVLAPPNQPEFCTCKGFPISKMTPLHIPDKPKRHEYDLIRRIRFFNAYFKKQKRADLAKFVAEKASRYLYLQPELRR